MKKVDVTWRRAIKVWWSFFWRATLFGVLGGALAGGIVGGIMGATGNLEHVKSVAQVLGYIIAVPVSLWSMKKVLEKEYKDFSTCLIENDETSI